MNSPIVFIVILIILAIACLSLVLLMINQKRNDVSVKLDDMYAKIRNDINFAVAPNSINLSPSADDLIQFAVEIWRVEKRVAKLKETLLDNQIRGLENSVQKFKRYFEKYDIEVVDYTNKKFNDGLNLDVLSVEKNAIINDPIIKETVEPTILYRGQVVKKAKIILLTK